MSSNITNQPAGLFYGWWVDLAAFLNLFFAVGLVFYGLPVFYPSLVESLGFSRSQVTAGIFWGFVLTAPLFGLLGALIDRVGARGVILAGVVLVAVPLVLMRGMKSLWQYYLLCIAEVVGYIMAGPIPNQVLVSNWFRARRGRAMGYAYLGLGLGGVVAPVLAAQLIARFGWRRGFEITGVLILLVLLPVGLWMTRSSPRDMGLEPDGAALSSTPTGAPPAGMTLGSAVGTMNFWLITLGSALIIGAIGTVIQQFVLFLRDQGYSTQQASRAMSGLLFAGLAGRVIVGFIADRYRKKNVMALFYLLLALAIPLLFLAQRPSALWAFAILFGFAMGADYMLIPLVTAECFGLAALGRLLGVIIMADSLAQWFGPMLAGKIFEATHSYNLAWGIITAAGVAGAFFVFKVNSQNIRSKP